MQHFPDDDSTTLDGPRITSLSLDRAPIHAKSTIGIVSSKGDEIFLQGNVEVLREADAQQSTLTLQTEFLRVIPDKDLMDTDRTVTIVDARDTLQATGMQMDNRARTIRLLSHVKGEYAPPR